MIDVASEYIHLHRAGQLFILCMKYDNGLPMQQ